MTYLDEFFAIVNGRANYGIKILALSKFFNRPDWSNGLPHHVKFTYYGGTWILESFSSKLFWIHKQFTSTDTERPLFLSHWNYWRNDLRSLKYIMKNHPNLKEKRYSLSSEDKVVKILDYGTINK